MHFPALSWEITSSLKRAKTKICIGSEVTLLPELDSHMAVTLVTPWSHMDYFNDGWMCFLELQKLRLY